MILSLYLVPVSLVGPAEIPVQNLDIASRAAASVREASTRFGISEDLIWAVMSTESAGNPRAISPKGASGLMQLMPATWETLRGKLNLGNDIFEVRDNIIAGTAYLREMYDRYGTDGFLAAYNAGPGRYEAHLTSGRKLPAETLIYMRKVRNKAGTTVAEKQAHPPSLTEPSWREASLFISLQLPPPSQSATPFAPVTGPFPEAPDLSRDLGTPPGSRGIPGQNPAK